MHLKWFTKSAASARYGVLFSSVGHHCPTDFPKEASTSSRVPLVRAHRTILDCFELVGMREMQLDFPLIKNHQSSPS